MAVFLTRGGETERIVAFVSNPSAVCPMPFFNHFMAACKSISFKVRIYLSVLTNMDVYIHGQAKNNKKQNRLNTSLQLHCTLIKHCSQGKYHLVCHVSSLISSPEQHAGCSCCKRFYKGTTPAQMFCHRPGMKWFEQG